MPHHLLLKNDTLRVHPDPATGALPPGSITDGPRRLGLPAECHDESINAMAFATNGDMVVLMYPSNKIYESGAAYNGRDSERVWTILPARAPSTLRGAPFNRIVESIRYCKRKNGDLGIYLEFKGDNPLVWVRKENVWIVPLPGTWRDDNPNDSSISLENGGTDKHIRLYLNDGTLRVYPDLVTGALPPGSIVDGPRRLGLPKELHESSIIALAKASDGRMALLLRGHSQDDVELYESSPSLTGRDSKRPWVRIDREQEPGLFTTSPTGIGYVKGQLTAYTATARDQVYARQNENFNPETFLENPKAIAVELIQAGLEAASRANSVLAVQTAFARAQACGIHASDLDMVAIMDAYYEKTARSGVGEPLDPEANLALIERMYQMLPRSAIAHPNVDVTLLDPAIVAAAHEAYHAIADLGDLALARRLARDLHLSLDFENPSAGHPSQAWQGVADRAGWHLLRRHCPGFAGHGTDTPWRFTPGLVVDSLKEGTPWFNVETGVMSTQEAARGWRYVGRLDLSAVPAVSPWLADRVEQPARAPESAKTPVEQRTAPRRRPG